LKKLPWATVSAVPAVSTDHGRRARRTIEVALAPPWIEFDRTAQVAQLPRTVTENSKKTVEVVYLITSDRSAGQSCSRPISTTLQAPCLPAYHVIRSKQGLGQSPVKSDKPGVSGLFRRAARQW
jgi:hypothetical protein